MIRRVLAAVRSLLDVRAWAHLLRVVHFYRYSYVEPMASAELGEHVRVSPLASLRNGERISIGSHTRIGERCCLWAGDTTGRITIGDHALFGPEVFITASNYGTVRGDPPMHQAKLEQNVVVGADVWLGARVVVLPGVTVGDGCIVGAGSVVADDLPASSIAVGVPATVVGFRQESA